MAVKKNLRTDEVAEYLSTSPRTVYRLIAEGQIVAFKLRGGPLRVPVSSVEDYVKRQVALYGLEADVSDLTKYEQFVEKSVSAVDTD